jgi:chromosomal replication initiator protein
MTRAGDVCAQSGLVDAILGVVHKRIGTQKFNAWFKNGTCVSLEDGCVKVGAPNPFVAGWIESHFTDDLITAAQEVTGRQLRLMVTVDPVLSGQLRKRQLDVQARLVARHTAGQARREAAPATSLRYELKDFNPLFIHGPCGVGKTHLLQGICNATASIRPEGRQPAWKYTTAEEFTNDFVTAIRHKKLETFRQTYRRLDVLAIDDVHFLAAKKATQEEFLHTFNTIESAGSRSSWPPTPTPKWSGNWPSNSSAGSSPGWWSRSIRRIGPRASESSRCLPSGRSSRCRRTCWSTSPSRSAARSASWKGR